MGFYRSHTRDELYMDKADLDLGSPLFRRSRKCIPDCEAVHDAPLRSQLFFWEDGEISRDSSYLLFPFQRRELGGGELQPAPRQPEPEGRSRPPTQAAQPEPGAALERYQPATVVPALSILKTAGSVHAPRPSAPSRLRSLALPALLLAVGAGSFLAYSSLKGPRTTGDAAAAQTGGGGQEWPTRCDLEPECRAHRRGPARSAVHRRWLDQAGSGDDRHAVARWTRPVHPGSPAM